MEDDWDLHAVVRSCCNTTTTTTTTSSSTTSSSGGAVGGGGCSIRSDFGSNQQQLSFSASGSGSSPVFGIDHQRSQTSSNNPPSLFSLPDPFEYRNSSVNGDLNELYLPFFPKSQSIFAPSQSSPLQISTFTISKNPTSHQLLQQQQQQLKKSVVSSGSSNSQTPRSKRRKNQLKKICQVPAEALSSDVWAWRKYGQKPIKGSPYPRGYYRCSTSKGCLARKQVERNRSDPGMFIVTYTAEHNHPAPTHRNSLAGSTRNKSLTPQSATGDESNAPSPPKPTCSSPGTSMEDEVLAQQSTNGESREEDKDLMEDEDEVELELGDMSEMEVTDDFFAGLEGLTGDPVTGGCFSDSFPANFGLPWHANNAAAAASSL